VRKALVADSTHVTQFMLERILSKEGYEILYVQQPRDLLDQLKTVKPDVLFLEAEISGGKGLRIAEYLSKRSDLSHIPIILITRIADPGRYSMESWPGVHRVVRKPLASAKVLEAVDSISFFDTRDLSALDAQSEAG